jgi:hypothetical protein
MCKIKTTSNAESLQVPIGNGGRFEGNIKRRQTDVEIGVAANLVGCEDLSEIFRGSRFANSGVPQNLQKEENRSKKNIQQQVFAGGHPPNY